MEKLGIEAESISFEKPILNRKTKVKFFVQILCRFSLPGDKYYWKSFIPKVIAFSKFNARYIHTVEVKTEEDVLSRNYDFYVFGSDQIWNPQWYELDDRKQYMYMLPSASSEKKICFSPSFGAEKLPDDWTEWFQKNLNNIDCLSVREQAGAKIIKDLTGKDVPVLIDPTLMLSAKEWSAISKKTKVFSEKFKYIIAYFIDGMSDKARNEIEQISKKYNLKIIDLMDLKHSEFYSCAPDEFIYLISKAEIVLTDSFHACVFSFIFDKPFLVYERQNECKMMSRMDTLFDKLGIEKRKFNDNDSDLFYCDYSKSKKKLKIEQKKVNDFLQGYIKRKV